LNGLVPRSHVGAFAGKTNERSTRKAITAARTARMIFKVE
jgi:hypothetical protein